jgi:hypothetical protein
LPNIRKADDDVMTKKAFALSAGISPSRVSQWIRSGQLSGDAIVGHGHRARIRVPVAMEQLKRNLDPVQHLGAAGRAQLDANAAAVPPTVEEDIKQARLQQLALSNAKARAEAAAQSGRYALAADARQEMGRIAGRLMATFESAFTEFANAIMATPPATSREALRTLRTTWRSIREQRARAIGSEAAALPPLLDDEEGEDVAGERTAARS